LAASRKKKACGCAQVVWPGRFLTYKTVEKSAAHSYDQPMRRTRSAALILAILVPYVGRVAADDYEPPPAYYNSATGTGSTLNGQLASVMTVGQVQRNYGNFRDSAAITDADPSQPRNIALVYN
jgi:hypothetical protein